MKGLSSKEIELRKKVLRSLKDKTNKDEQELNELDFRSWVNSCLIYSMDYKLTQESLTEYNYSFFNTTLKSYRVELERALQIIEEQKERFKNATVKQNVYTDCEGCTYNNCEWED